MRCKAGFLAFAVVLAVAGMVLPAAERAAQKGPAKAAPPGQALAIAKLKISGPYTHDNLAVFLLHGKDRVKLGKFLTLKEALEQKKIVIRETGRVSQLTVENVGGETIYIQSGEIIKGGKQDRMLQYDYIVPPKSGRQPISSLCVERGRWSRRGAESVDQFVVSDNAAVGNAMKLAAKLDNNQGKVWQEVAKAQNKLSSNAGTFVNDARSSTSLQLSLENKKLKEMAAAYQKKHAKLAQEHNDAIGFAVAINGEVVSLDTYACHDLFAKLWPKLLETSAFEAIAELKKDANFTHPAAANVRKFAAEVEKARSREKQISDKLRMKIRETPAAAAFETRGPDDQEIHRSYHKK